ncbi:hypothetical protein V6N13_096170 [Hibiscus sabdariffa]|uniref:Uncharacterized protein n=1 Tax=Hibiscus sabdariffa TaxID=183260 RepID=A0ABR2DJH1_9ROSI
MLAGCSSSTLLSPRQRLRSEASAQFQACHFPTPMSTQRLDLSCSFSRKDTTSRSQPIRPLGLSLEKPIESKTIGCSLKQNIRLPPLTTAALNPFEGRREIKDELWEKGKCLKRFADGLIDESVIDRAKRKKGNIHDWFWRFWFQPSFTRQGAPQVPFFLTGSGDEERVCFVPSEVISLPLPSSNNPWTGSVITEITNVEEKDVETIHRPVEASESSTSSESHSLGLRLNELATEHEVGNGSGNPRPHEGALMGAYEEENNHRECRNVFKRHFGS